MTSRVIATFTHDYRQSMSPCQSDHDHGYGRDLLRALDPRLVGTLTVKLAMDRPLTFEPTNDLLIKSIHWHTTRHILVVPTLKHLSQTCAGWVKMLHVYYVIFTFEVNKDSVIIQRDAVVFLHENNYGSECSFYKTCCVLLKSSNIVYV